MTLLFVLVYACVSNFFFSVCIKMMIDTHQSYCKPQQYADQWKPKMSENSKFSKKYLHKNVPGAASAQGRKSKLWYNTPNKI